MNAPSNRIRNILDSIARSNTSPASGPHVAYPVSPLDEPHRKASRGRRRTQSARMAVSENIGVVSSLSGSLLAFNFGLLTAILMFESMLWIGLVGVSAGVAGAIVGWHIGYGLAKQMGSGFICCPHGIILTLVKMRLTPFLFSPR